jgi:hypothetical protein
VKQAQLGLLHPPGQLHSEQRRRHCVEVVQQNHSPEVEQPTGQPPPCWQVLHGNASVGPWPHGGAPTHGLQGPPPQPMHPETDPRATSLRVRTRPAPSELAVMNLKNCRRDDFRASVRAIACVIE